MVAIAYDSNSSAKNGITCNYRNYVRSQQRWDRHPSSGAYLLRFGTQSSGQCNLGARMTPGENSDLGHRGICLSWTKSEAFLPVGACQRLLMSALSGSEERCPLLQKHVLWMQR